MGTCRRYICHDETVPKHTPYCSPACRLLAERYERCSPVDSPGRHPVTAVAVVAEARAAGLGWLDVRADNGHTPHPATETTNRVP